jgi:hypothetical protein
LFLLVLFPLFIFPTVPQKQIRKPPSAADG